MKPGYDNPFCQAVRDVFKLMLDVDVKPGTASQETVAALEQEVAVQVGLTGDVTGAIVFHFPQQMTMDMVKLLCGMEVDKVDAFVTSALAEMSNIISGNATTLLAQANCVCDILPPQIHVGDDVVLAATTNQSAAVPLLTELGCMVVDLSQLDSKKA